MDTSKSQPVVLLLVAVASVFIITWGIKSSAAILNPILLAAVITIVVLPLPQYLTKRGLPSWLSFVLTLLMVVGGLVAIIFLVLLSFANMGTSSANLVNSVDSFLPADMTDADAVSGFINSFESNFSLISGVLTSFGSAVGQIFMVILIFVFMLSGAMVTPDLKRLDPSTTSAMQQVTVLTQDVRRYMSIMTAVNFAVALGNVVLLWMLGVDSAGLWGLLAFVTGYIPTVGFWIALIPPVIIAYATLGTGTAVIVFIGYVLINGTVQNIIQPRMMGQGLGISTIVVFISLFVWGWLLGGIGAILSVPLTMIIMAILYHFEDTRWIALLMSAPRNEKSAAHIDAREKLQNIWQRTKHPLQRGEEVNRDE